MAMCGSCACGAAVKAALSERGFAGSISDDYTTAAEPLPVWPLAVNNDVPFMLSSTPATTP